MFILKKSLFKVPIHRLVKIPFYSLTENFTKALNFQELEKRFDYLTNKLEQVDNYTNKEDIEKQKYFLDILNDFEYFQQKQALNGLEDAIKTKKFERFSIVLNQNLDIFQDFNDQYRLFQFMKLYIQPIDECFLKMYNKMDKQKLNECKFEQIFEIADIFTYDSKLDRQEIQFLIDLYQQKFLQIKKDIDINEKIIYLHRLMLLYVGYDEIFRFSQYDIVLKQIILNEKQYFIDNLEYVKENEIVDLMTIYNCISPDQKFEKKALYDLSIMKSQSISNLILNYRYNKQLFYFNKIWAYLEEEILNRMLEFNLNTLTNILESFQFHNKLTDDLLYALYKQFLINFHQIEIQDIPTILEQFAKHKLKVQPLFDALKQVVLENIEKFSNENLVQILFSFNEIQQLYQQFFDTINDILIKDSFKLNDNYFGKYIHVIANSDIQIENIEFLINQLENILNNDQCQNEFLLNSLLFICKRNLFKYNNVSQKLQQMIQQQIKKFNKFELIYLSQQLSYVFNAQKEYLSDEIKNNYIDRIIDLKDEFYETELIPIIDVCEEAQFSNLEELKQIIYKM